MKDFFTEQLIKHNITPRENKLRIIYICVYAVLISYIIFNFIIMSGNNHQIGIFVIGLFICAGLIYLAYRQITGFDVEFEYTYTDGILDIDVIRHRSRRKTVFTAGVADFEIMAHIDDTEHLSMYKELPAVDFGSGETKDNTYVFVTVYNGKKCRYIIEPKPELLKAMLADLTPRRLFIKK